MRFKKYSAVLIGLGALCITACDANLRGLPDENIIGLRLETISHTNGIENQETLDMFDETTRRIHSFNLRGEGLVKSFEVLNPEDDHFIIASNDSSFLVDLSQSQMSVYRYDGSASLDVVPFMGKPVSSAYNKNTGHLVVYDNLNSVSLLKINDAGDITKLWIGGPLVTGEGSILSGDISPSGELILSLANGSLAIVDIEESIDQEQWVYRLDTSIPHSGVKWVAVISADLILYQNPSKLVLYNYTLGTVLSEKDYPAGYEILGYGKTKDPHVIYKNQRLLNREYFVAYVDGGEIKLKELVNHRGNKDFSQSRLDISANEFSYIGKTSTYLSGEEESFHWVDQKTNRVAFGYRFSDMLVTSRKQLPDGAELTRAKNYVFALFPSELGYAEKISTKSEQVETLSNFNVLYIDENLVRMKANR